ncbi:MAG: DUF2189 domain-containing protein [Pseudomonadota bacterium]
MATQIDREEMPFAAPCRRLSPLAPFRWLACGYRDLLAAPRPSLVYGGAVAALTAIVTLLAWFQGSQWFLFAMLGGFVFMAPLCCIGLYAISAQLERQQRPLLLRSLRAALYRHVGNEMVFAMVLLVVFLVWARAAVMVTVFFPTDADATTADFVAFYVFGTSVGSVFAAITFSASAFSLPMIMHRDVDSITAIVTSVNAVLRNLPTMLVWLGLIVALLVAGIATACLGLVVVVPLIGFAAWHGYLETIDASDFPRHPQGITATPRG